MTAIYALYSDPAQVQRAVDSLRAAGLADRDIVVISSEPIEEYEFGDRDKATWLFYIAACGGVLGLVFATWLTTMSQKAWPLPTGNMPIVAWWPNTIIMFELTMLGAILATVIAMLVASGLPSRGPKMYDPEITDGKILVGIQNPPAASVQSIERALLAGGVPRLKTIGPRP